MPEPDPKQQPTLKPLEDRILTIIGAIFLSLVSILALALIWRIITADTSLSTYIIGSGSSSDTATLTQSNERLLQMVQWTLGLVITVGGLLVGFSWFQNRTRFDDDRQRLLDWKEELKEGSRIAREDAATARQELADQKNLFETQSATLTTTLEAQQVQSTQLQESIQQQLAAADNLRRKLLESSEMSAMANVRRSWLSFLNDPDDSYEVEEILMLINHYFDFALTFASEGPISDRLFDYSAKALTDLVGQGATVRIVWTSAELERLKSAPEALWPRDMTPQVIKRYELWDAALDALIASIPPDDPESDNE